MKALIAILMMLTVAPAFAAEEGIAGETTLKLDESDFRMSTRELRKELSIIDQDLAIQDQAIANSNAQAASYRGLLGSQSHVTASLTALNGVQKMQRAEREAQRTRVIDELSLEN